MAFIRCGGGGGMTETTLWTNSSPSSNFSSQTVSLNQSYTGFDYIRFYYRGSTSNSEVRSCMIAVSDFTGKTFAFGGNFNFDNSKCRGCYNSGSSQIYFSYSYELKSSSQTSSSAYIIPTKITGVKLS